MNTKTELDPPLSMEEFILELENPQVYSGREINAIRKDIAHRSDFIHVCLVFPDKYEIGMSHYGLLLLYHVLNRLEKLPVNAERCFLPSKASIQVFKHYRMPLFSIENKIPLKEFDVIGFSLLSEMNYTNVLQVLELAQIPLRSKERDKTFPIVAAGGISAVNPEPLRDFIDIFGIGDGEALFPDILQAVSESKKSNSSKKELLTSLGEIEGVYVPSLHPAVKKGRFYGPDLKTGTIRKRVLKSLDAPFPDEHMIVPIGNVIFSRLNVEIARGCPHNCRFCQAKSYYAPYRACSLESNISSIIKGLKSTGFEAFSLSTLSAGDYPYLGPLLEAIPGIISTIPGGVFSFSSLRPASLSNHLLSTLALFKRTGITIVPEAGTQRLRGVINKNVTDEEIFQAVELAIRNRWQKIKLYFMVGLPTETMEDIDGIVQIIRRVLDIAKAARQRITVHASFSPFVPKPHTPLQWARRQSPDELRSKIDYLKSRLCPRGSHPDKSLDLDFHAPINSIVETILARGDYRVGELLLSMLKQGEIFSAWDYDFHYPLWAEIINNSFYEDFFDEFSLDEPLPWDFLEINFKNSYLKQEYSNALAGVPTSSCTHLECKTCGGCIFGMKPIDKDNLAPGDADLEKPIPQPAKKDALTLPTGYKKARIFYQKVGDFRYFSHLSLMQYIERLIRRSGVRFKCSEGFTPRIKMSTLSALPVFASGLNEVIELFVDASLSSSQILELLHKSTQAGGFTFTAVKDCEGTPSLSRDIHYITHEIEVDYPQEAVTRIAGHLGETDSAEISQGRLVLKMDFSRQGQERFSAIYKILDPEKNRTIYLTRAHVTFKSEPGAIEEEKNGVS